MLKEYSVFDVFSACESGEGCKVNLSVLSSYEPVECLNDFEFDLSKIKICVKETNDGNEYIFDFIFPSEEESTYNKLLKFLNDFDSCDLSEPPLLNMWLKPHSLNEKAIGDGQIFLWWKELKSDNAKTIQIAYSSEDFTVMRTCSTDNVFTAHSREE